MTKQENETQRQADLARSAIHLMKVKFHDPVVEQQYRQAEAGQSLWLYRWAIGVSVLLHLSYIPIDYVVLGDKAPIMMFEKVILSVLSLGVWLATYKRWFIHHVVGLTSFLWIFNMASKASGIVLFDADTVMYFTAGSVMIMMYTYILLYSYFWIATLLSMILVMINAVLLIIMMVPIGSLATGIEVLCASLFILAMGGYRAAIISRIAFYVSGLLAKQESTKAERRRIMRDLHDDVAAKLLSLMHRTKDADYQAQAREALGSLRQVIYALDDNQPVTLTDFLNELQSTIRDRVRNGPTELVWQETDSWPEVTLSAREHINLLRAVQEGVSNALQHGNSPELILNPQLKDSMLVISITNGNVTLQVEDWKPGKGLNNIRTRMQEIGGDVNWNVAKNKISTESECCLDLSLPLSVANAS